MKKNWLSLVFMFFLSYSCDEAIPEIKLVEVTGMVVETQSQSPISGASVAILNQAEIDTLLTGNDGVFNFSNLRLDDATYELWVSHPDYNVETTVFTVENGVQKDDITVGLLTSDALDFDLEVMDFGSGENEIGLTITNVSSRTETVTITVNPSWLEVSEEEVTLASGRDETLLFTVERTAVEVGSYETDVVFEIEGKPTQTVTAKMQKLDPNSAILTLDANTFDFGKATESRGLKISNTGMEELDWTATSNAAWLSVSSTEGSVEVGEDVSINVMVNREGFENGSYESTVDFGGNGGTATLTVQMEVDNSVGLLKLSTTALDLGIESTSTQVTLTNDGTNSLTWEATIRDSWISLDATSGSLEVGANTTLNITVDRSSLDAGSFEGSIDFVAEGETTTLNIALEVQGGILEISETSLNLGSAEGNRLLTFSNVGMRSLDWISEENTSWLNLAPKEGTLEVDQEASVLVEVDRTGLALGDYSASILISSEGTDFTINVTMTVAQDTDGDGVPDEIDADVDGDGLIEIYTVNDLNDIRNDLDASGEGKQGAPAGGFTGYELMNDLDFSSDDSYDDLSLKPDVTAGSGWEPLGLNVADFDAIFDGNGFTISNLLINRTSNYSALFAGTRQFAEIRNLHLEIRFLSGNNYTAGLIGWNNGTVSNCSVSGDIEGVYACGLLIGVHAQGTVEDSYSEGFMSSTSTSIGGLIGTLGNPLNFTGGVIEISNCYSTANPTGRQWIGGLIGSVQSSRFSGSILISSCYSTGNVSATPSTNFSPGAGGLIAQFSDGTIRNCYSSSNVTSSVSSSTIYDGGLVGSNSGTIESSFAYGEVVSNASSIGGLVGLNSGSITATNYWDIEATGRASSAGGTGLTTAELQTPTSADGIYITWLPDVWDFGTTTQYPALKGMPNGLEAQRD